MKIIGECGCNWQNLDEAKQMIKACRDNGIDFSKFQLFTEKEAPNLPEHLYLSFEEAKELYKYGKSIGQEVFFTPMFYEAVEWLEEIGVEYVKIRYKDNTYYSLIEHAYRIFYKNTFISIDNKYRIYDIKYQCPEINYLFCMPIYPSTYLRYNFPFYRLYRFDGISDHTSNISLLKACIQKFNDTFTFEKHVKLREDCLESEWSVYIDEVGEVIGKYG